MNTQDITLDSLKGEQHKDVGKLKILLDGERTGDTTENIGVVSPERRKQKADLYRRDFFDGISIPHDMYRYLHFFFIQEPHEPLKYKSVEEIQQKYYSPDQNLTDSEYRKVLDIIKYSVNDPEASQVIGFILIFTSMLRLMRDRKMTVLLVFENPLHEIVTIGRFFALIELMVEDTFSLTKTNK